jgi:signal transduction histidine kinase
MDTNMEGLDGVVFRGKINRRLSFFFVFLFFLVLLVGAVSRYLAQTMLLNAERIKQVSERDFLGDRIDDTFHHFVTALEQAALRGTAIPDTERIQYLQELYRLLERYRAGDGGERGVTGGISQVVAELASLSQKLTTQPKHAFTLSDNRLNAQDLAILSDAERRIQAFAYRQSEKHRARMEQEVTEGQQKMQLISVLYTTFVFIGGLFIISSSIFFFQAIAKPLRRLVHQASEIADGNLDNRVPVTSTDEIGQLSYFFNFMVGRLKEHETKLKVLAKVEERELVAQELHDSLAQDLAILRFRLAEAEKDFPLDGGAAMKDVLGETRKTVDRAYRDVRQAILGLHSAVSKSLSFVPTLTEYIRHFSEMSKISVDLEVDSPETTCFKPDVEIQLLRIIHEALTNVFKHAHATRSVVRFERDGDSVKMAIEDNGTGLVTNEGTLTGLRFGLQSMRKRAEGIGGKFSVEGVVGKGTRVIVCLPSQ